MYSSVFNIIWSREIDTRNRNEGTECSEQCSQLSAIDFNTFRTFSYTLLVYARFSKLNNFPVVQCMKSLCSFRNSVLVKQWRKGEGEGSINAYLEL